MVNTRAVHHRCDGSRGLSRSAFTRCPLSSSGGGKSIKPNPFLRSGPDPYVRTVVGVLTFTRAEVSPFITVESNGPPSGCVARACIRGSLFDGKCRLPPVTTLPVLHRCCLRSFPSPQALGIGYPWKEGSQGRWNLFPVFLASSARSSTSVFRRGNDSLRVIP